MRYVMPALLLLFSISQVQAKVVCPFGYVCKDNGNHKIVVTQANLPTIVVFGPVDYCDDGFDTGIDVDQGKVTCSPR